MTQVSTLTLSTTMFSKPTHKLVCQLNILRNNHMRMPKKKEMLKPAMELFLQVLTKTLMKNFPDTSIRELADSRPNSK